MSEHRPHRPSFARALFELLSSMRFAIALLTVLAIASVIGTVLKQNEPYNNYRIEFGEFWFSFFEPLGLFDVYHSSWFLVLLVFLVLSITLCIWRQWPGMLRDIKSFRESAADKSLRAMPHHAESETPLDLERARDYLKQQGFRFRESQSDGIVALAAKKGAGQRLGYLFAHTAIVVICVGGLIDGNLPLKLRELAGIKVPETRDVPQSQIPEQSRLDADNPSFRGNVTVPEGSIADVIFLNSGDGYFVQELPFAIQLKDFHVEHYSTGQPKRFASDIVLIDKKSGKPIKSGTVEVNKPLIHDGVAVYQASFGDGGSPMELKQWSLGAPGEPVLTKVRSQATAQLEFGAQPWSLELGDLRVFNIETMGEEKDQVSTVAVSKIETALASARNVKAEHNVRNVGPSIQFKLRDDAGQAHEYLNYLAPFFENDALYLLSGVRATPQAPFAFVRFPLDGEGKLDTFMRLRQAMLDGSLHAEIAKRTAAKALAGGGISQGSSAQFEDITLRILQQFTAGGFPALETFLDEKVPEEQRATVAQTYLKILQGAALEAMDVAQEQAKLPKLNVDEKQYRFLMDSLVATSALFDYGSPVYFQPVSFEEIQASGFQIARAPGQTIVYIGCLLLVIGIYCMFYMREQRLWIRSRDGRTLIAMTANRHDSELDRSFERHLAELTGPSGNPTR
ncbi:cytochrome c biogenesis protein ResB [Chitinibacteraceae bacterium HSL-7]